MALQLNKICRGLIQNGQKILASKAETVCSKEVHTEIPQQNFSDVHNSGKLLEALPSLLNKFPLSKSPIRTYASKCGKRAKPKCNNSLKCKQSKCPKFYLEGCDCPAYCLKKRIECKKRPAPYPSYSEACAEELDENPSECVQCPWKHCPEFKVNYRKYHTGRGVHAAPVKGSISTPAILDPELLNDEIFAHKNKKPCERPDSPCEKRRKLIERLRREKARRECEEQKKKKCAPLTWTEALRLVAQKRDFAPVEAPLLEEQIEDQPAALFNKKKKPPNRDCGGENRYRCPDSTYEAFEYDPREADYEHKRRRRSGATDKPCCANDGKRRKVPDCGGGCQCGAAHDVATLIAHECPEGCKCPLHAGALAMHASLNLCEQLNYDLAKVNSGYEKCPPKKQKYPDVDKTINLRQQWCRSRKPNQITDTTDPCHEDYRDPDYMCPHPAKYVPYVIKDRLDGPVYCPCKPKENPKHKGKKHWRLRKPQY